ncbi:hypothetical protein RhiXN_11612 [Rhizoctonia solani]|uniref:Uncharacterized protein n=1 Tax=Rhizoctonia solani TaxID=456999 RepID=A0A8H8P3T4_9AGAM|nr:uncharacterized protein RhiXN_11612 [Rhizoctonia solani]QRW24700.1 hypothetical protein RhiXN_11612 [Rhizoctonia solani]
MTPLYGTSPPSSPRPRARLSAQHCPHQPAHPRKMQRKKQRGIILEALESAESTEGGVVGRADGDRLMYVDPDGSALPARAFVTCPNPDGSQGLAPFRKYRAASSPFSPTQPKLIALGRIAMALSHNPLPASSTHTVASSNRTICLLKHAYTPDNDGDCLAPFFTSFESRMVRSRDDRRGAQRGDSRAQNWFVFFVSYDSATAF